MLSYNPALNKTLLYKAYCYAAKAHEGQTRKDGSPYITHPLAVANIVADLKLDTDALCAALLHDCIEDTKSTHEDISREFSPTIADLVEGVTKLTRMQLRVHGREADGESAQDAHGHEQGHPGHPGQALRPAAQYAHDAVSDAGETAGKVPGDHGDLRPHRSPAGYAAHQVGAGGSGTEISGPHRLSGD